MANVTFVLERGDLFPMFKATDGGIYVPIFETRDAATHYIQINGMGDEWEIRELTGLVDICDWLNNARSQGVTYITKDPQGDEVSVVPLDVVLNELGFDP